MVSLEMQQRIAMLREKARSGTLTIEEMKEAVAFLRQERMAMPASAPKPKSAKAQAAAINPDDLLGELGI